jgi:hypothetical protein
MVGFTNRRLPSHYRGFDAPKGIGSPKINVEAKPIPIIFAYP